MGIKDLVMSLPDNGLVRITLNQTHQGQQVRNVFWYRAEDAVGGDAALGIGQTFWEVVRTAWRAFTPATTLLTFDSVDVRYMDGDLDYAVYTIPEAERQGTRTAGTAQLMPVFIAANITLNPANRQVRPASKRIGGLLETDNNANAIELGTRSLLGALGTAFTATLASGGFIDFLTPVVVGMPNANRPTRLLIPIVSHQVGRNVTTQNSRKVGRGI